MNKTIKRNLIIFLATLFLFLSFFAFGSFVFSKSYASDSDNKKVIVTLDSAKEVNKLTANYYLRNSLSYSHGYLNLTSKYTNIDGVILDPGKELENKDDDGFSFQANTSSFGNISLDDYRYFQMKIKRTNCLDSKLQFYVWNNKGQIASRDFKVGNIDDKWVVITIDLYQLNSAKKAVWLYDVETKETKDFVYTSSATSEFEYYFDYCRINLGRGDSPLPNKEAQVEYIAFFNNKEEALSFSGNSEERLFNAETILKDDSTKITSLFGDANTEEKAIKEVSEQISNIALVGSEIIDYTFTPSTIEEKGRVDFSVMLQSAGKEIMVDNLTMYIDEIPSSPIMIRFNNKEILENLTPCDVTMTIEDEGYVKMTKIDPRVEDCFFFEFNTPGLTDKFLLQNYPYIKLKIKPMQVSGKFQIFYSDFIHIDSHCRAFLTNWEVGQWQTIILDMSKNKDAVEILNLETGKTTIENCYNGNWTIDPTVGDYSGESSDFRFTFGRKDNLERTTYIEYISFFPTLEMARNYDEEVEKFKADTISHLQSKEKAGSLIAEYGNALSVNSAEEVALSIVEEEAKNCFVTIKSVDFVPATDYINGKYVFTAEIENNDLGVVFETPEIVLTIKNKEDSSNILWKFDNENILSNLFSNNDTTKEIKVENSALHLFEENSGFNVDIPLNERLSLLGYPIIKIKYKAENDVDAVIDVINDAYKFGINFKFKKSQNYTETILSLSSLEQYYGSDETVEKITTIGELYGLFKSFVLKLNGEIDIEYISFSTDLSLARAFNGESNSQSVLDDFLNSEIRNKYTYELEKIRDKFTYYDEYNKASSLEEAKENIIENIKTLLTSNIVLDNISFDNFVEPSALNSGSLHYIVTLTTGGIFNRAETAVEGTLYIDKMNQEIYKAVSEEGNGDFEYNYHEFWGTDYFYDTKASNYSSLFPDSKSYDYTNYLYSESDLTEIPNSFEIWIRLFKNQKGREQVIFNNNSIRIAVANDGNIKIKFSNYEGTTENIDLFDSTWHHFALVRNEKIIKIYIDGVEKYSFDTIVSTCSEKDKKAYSIGGELYNADGRLVANDVILDVSLWKNNSINFTNDSIFLGLDNGYFYSDFYRSNTYSFKIKPQKYVRLINDIDNGRIITMTNGQIENLYKAKDIIYSLNCSDDKYVNIFGQIELNSDSKAVLFFRDEETFSVNYNDVIYSITTNIYGQTTIKLENDVIAELTVLAWNNFRSCCFSTEILETALSGRIGKIAIYSSSRTETEILEDAKINNYDVQSSTNLITYIKMDYSEVISSGKIIYNDLSSSNNYLRIFASGFYKTNLKNEDCATFSIIGDVQNHAVQGKETFNDIIVKWILDNRERLNISASFSVGDITQNATATEWQWVYDSYSQFDNIIPFLVALGNHDYPSLSGRGAESRDTSGFNSVWEYEKYKEINRSYGDFDVFEIGKMENAYLCFDVDTDCDDEIDNKFILISMEYGPRDETLEWVNQTLEKYSDRNAILFTHALVRANKIVDGDINKDVLTAGFAKDSSVNEGIDILEKVVKRNKNIVAVYCGHLGADELAFHSYIEEYYDHNVFISIVDMSSAGRYFPSNCNLIGLMSFDKEGQSLNYMYSPLYSAYFNTDLIKKYTMDLLENRG